MIDVPVIKATAYEHEYNVTQNKTTDELIRDSLSSQVIISRRRVLPFTQPPSYPQTEKDWDNFFLHSRMSRNPASPVTDGFDGLVEIAQSCKHYYFAYDIRAAIFAVSVAPVVTDIILPESVKTTEDVALQVILNSQRLKIHYTPVPNIVVGFNHSNVNKVYFMRQDAWAIFARDPWNVYAIGID